MLKIVLSRGPDHLSAAEDVQMDMIDLLAAILVRIDDDTITGIGYALILRYRGSLHEQMTQQRFIFFRYFSKGGYLSFRNEQYMDRGFRVYIPERNTLIILVYDGSRYLFVYNLREYGTHDRLPLL